MIEFKTSDDFKVFCTERTLPPSPGFVISEPDTFILSQLMKIRNINDYHEAENIIFNVEKGDYIFFQSMNESMKKEFIYERKSSKFGKEEQDWFITDFIFTFLEDCLKRAEEKAKCQ